MAPVVFGSGISNFILPEIQEVDESIHFSNYYFMNMGEGILFTSEVNERYEV